MSDDKQPDRDEPDQIPRQSLWATLPKRSLPRVLILLALLAGILVLRARAGSIAGCMSEAFRAPAPAQPGVRVRARIVAPERPPEVPAR
jgi:hypothetical protein